VKLLYERTILEQLPSSVFECALLDFLRLTELLKRTDTIKYADDYIKNFNPALKQKYAKEYPIADIKADIAEFIDEWLNSIKDEYDIHHMKPNRPSESYGFSNYIELSFNRPTDRRLFPFYAANKNLYNNVKFRFSEHDPKNDASDIEDSVIFTGKTFDQAAQEMEYRISNYVVDLRAKEKRYLKDLEKKNKKRR
jgi:hypothetical protein